jgi:hypothetical protein
LKLCFYADNAQKVKKILLLAILFSAGVSAVFADGPTPPAGGCDIDQTCPIDTWIIAFAALSLIATTIYLYKRQTKAVDLSNN